MRCFLFYFPYQNAYNYKISIVLVSLESARAKARDTKRKEDFRSIQTALEMYHLEHGEYPSVNGEDTTCASDWDCWNGVFGNKLKPYLDQMPQDPRFFNKQLAYGQWFVYVYQKLDGSYCLAGTLENQDDPEISQKFDNCHSYYPNWPNYSITIE